MRGKKYAGRVEIRNARLEVTIVATYDLTTASVTEVESELETAIDTLRSTGSADIVKRTLTGEPVR